jgi:Tfp pilus assembly protein PilO
MNQLRSSRRAQIAAAAAFVVVIVAGGWFLLVKPKREKADTLDAKVVDVRAQVAERKEELAKPYARIEIRAADLYRLTRAIPAHPEMSGVLLQLDRLAKGNKVKLQSVAPGGAVAGSGVNELPIAVEVRGRFANVTGFLGAVQKLTRVKKGHLDSTGRLYVVKSVNLAEDSEQGFPSVSGQLGLSTYVFTGAPTPTTPAPTDTTGEEPSTQSASPSGSSEAAGANP